MKAATCITVTMLFSLDAATVILEVNIICDTAEDISPLSLLYSASIKSHYSVCNQQSMIVPPGTGAEHQRCFNIFMLHSSVLWATLPAFILSLY